MNELQAILTVVAFALGVAAFYFAQRAAQTRAELRKSQALARSREQQIEEGQKKLQNRTEDIDQLKRQLQDARNKLERLKKDIHQAKTQAQAKARADDEPSPDSAAKRVRVSSQELEAEHRRRVEKLESELKRARDEAEALRRKEKARAAEAEKAKKALLADEGLDAAHAAPAEDSSPEAQVEAMRGRMDALQTAAATRERELKKKLNRAESDARAALKRASNNHALYLVIKGQLEVAEDRLALLRRKYEGAKRPHELSAAEPLPEEAKADAPTTAPSPPGDDVAALTATEPAANDATGEIEPPPAAPDTPATDAESPEKS